MVLSITIARAFHHIPILRQVIRFAYYRQQVGEFATEDWNVVRLLESLLFGFRFVIPLICITHRTGHGGNKQSHFMVIDHQNLYICFDFSGENQLCRLELYFGLLVILLSFFVSLFRFTLLLFGSLEIFLCFVEAGIGILFNGLLFGSHKLYIKFG